MQLFCEYNMKCHLKTKNRILHLRTCCNDPMPTSNNLLHAYYDINASKCFSIMHIEKNKLMENYR